MDILKLPDDGAPLIDQPDDDDDAAAAEDSEWSVTTSMCHPPPSATAIITTKKSLHLSPPEAKSTGTSQISFQKNEGDADDDDVTIKRSKLDWMVTEAVRKATESVLNHLRPQSVPPNREDDYSSFYLPKRSVVVAKSGGVVVNDAANSPTLSEDAAMYGAMVNMM